MTVPLAKDGGVTHWILVDHTLPPNERPILGSCETLRKRVLISKNSVVTEGITHGIGSVFCDPKYRGKGYASRMMKELGLKLKEWQTDKTQEEPDCPFSFLYSDIGKKYYAAHGWHVYPSTHVTLPPMALPSASTANVQLLGDADIEAFCILDGSRIKKELSENQSSKIQVALLPDHDVMVWHHAREQFMTSKIFGKTPQTKGAVAGSPGSRVWAIWTRSFYGPLVHDSGNALHILRLVVEDNTSSDQNAEHLKSILQLAQAEALEWKVSDVQFWNPTETVKELMHKTGLEWKEEDRESESITSLMWYGEGSGKSDEIAWVANEKYGWC